MNQRISPVVVVSVLVWAIVLQYCVPCMPCLAYSNPLQSEREREKKLGYYPKCCGFSQ